MVALLWIIAFPVFAGLVIKWISGFPQPIKISMNNYGTPGPFYWLKRIYALIFLSAYKLQLDKRLDFFDTKSRDFKKLGVVPTKREWELELPRPLETSRSNDVAFFHGSDGKGTTLVAKISRHLGRQCEVFFLLVRPNGFRYELACQPDTTVFNTDGKIFSAAGLTMEVIEPFRKWRVCFNGQARKTATLDGSSELVHLRMNGIWTAICRPFEVDKEFSPQLLAKAVAREVWRNRRDSWKELCKSTWTSFEQWGTTYTSLREGEGPEEVFYLRGLRQRRFGDVSNASVRRNLLLIGQSEEGVYFTLRGTCDSWRLSHEVAGHMYHPSGLVLPITRCDLELADIGHYGVLPPRFSLRFTGGHHSRYHLSIQKLPISTETFRGRPWNRRVQHFLCDMTVNAGMGWGVVELSNRYTENCPLPREESLPSLQFSSSPRDKVPLGLLLSDDRAKNVDLSGGKGSSLAILTSIEKVEQETKFSVPAGFVLTTASFEKQLAEVKTVSSALKSLEDAVRGVREGDLHEETEKASKAIAASSVCDSVKSTIEECLEQLFGGSLENISFAVRSSGVTEDSEVLSAAGQNETFLNCKGLEAVLKAVSKCWASAYKLPSVQYRRQHGQPVRTSIAVVVQEMVNPDVSGVLFTCDPASGNPAKIYITSNYGLGESVVSGKSEPDTIVIAKDFSQELRVETEEIGGKSTKIIFGVDGDTEEVEVSSDERARCSLTQELSLAVARVGVVTEKFFGMPRDNEFCILEGRIYLLQSRPVTHVRNWTDFELTHELDSAVVTDFDMFTKANTGEVFPGASTPLCLSTVAKSLDLAIQNSFVERQGGSFAVQPQTTRFVPVTHHHAMLNVIDTMLSNNDPEISATNRAVDMAVYGHIVTTKEMLMRGIQRFGVLSPLGKMKSMLLIGYDFLVNSWRIKWSEQQLNLAKIHHDVCEDPVELFRRICNAMPSLLSISQYHTQTSEFATTMQLISFLIVSENKVEWTPDILGKMAQLLSASTMAESGEVPEAMQNIANAICKSKDADEFKLMPVDVAIVWLQTDPGLSGELFRAFIKKHGHRCIREFDVFKQTWSMDPCPVVSILQSIVATNGTGDDRRTAEKKKEIGQVTEQLLESMKPETRRFLKLIMPFAKKSVTTREATKSLLIKMVHELRLAFRKLAQLLAWNGSLISEDLLFFFTLGEIDRYIQTGDPSLLQKAVKRQKLYLQWDNLDFPETSTGVPAPEKEKDDTHVATTILRATPVCNGRVKGKAIVILNVAEAVNIKRGDILITKCTDIGWSPYFPLLGGVVTELGGLISHGAVVAREYGLPCIVGANRAASLFSTGDVVILDGALGTLEKIQEL